MRKFKYKVLKDTTIYYGCTLVKSRFSYTGVGSLNENTVISSHGKTIKVPHKGDLLCFSYNNKKAYIPMGSIVLLNPEISYKEFKCKKSKVDKQCMTFNNMKKCACYRYNNKYAKFECVRGKLHALKKKPTDDLEGYIKVL